MALFNARRRCKLIISTADAARPDNRRQEGKNMKAYYKGFIIEQDMTIDTEVYYIRREDGQKFTAWDGKSVSIDSIQDNFPNVIEYIAAITE